HSFPTRRSSDLLGVRHGDLDPGRTNEGFLREWEPRHAYGHDRRTRQDRAGAAYQHRRTNHRSWDHRHRPQFHGRRMVQLDDESLAVLWRNPGWWMLLVGAACAERWTEIGRASCRERA